jgi:hypothetical protein
VRIWSAVLVQTMGWARPLQPSMRPRILRVSSRMLRKVAAAISTACAGVIHRSDLRCGVEQQLAPSAGRADGSSHPRSSSEPEPGSRRRRTAAPTALSPLSPVQPRQQNRQPGCHRLESVILVAHNPRLVSDTIRPERHVALCRHRPKELVITLRILAIIGP